MSLQRERPFILALLLILATASWAVLIWQSSMMNNMGMGLTMGMGATFPGDGSLSAAWPGSRDGVGSLAIMKGLPASSEAFIMLSASRRMLSFLAPPFL